MTTLKFKDQVRKILQFLSSHELLCHHSHLIKKYNTLIFIVFHCVLFITHVD